MMFNRLWHSKMKLKHKLNYNPQKERMLILQRGEIYLTKIKKSSTTCSTSLEVDGKIAILPIGGTTFIPIYRKLTTHN